MDGANGEVERRSSEVEEARARRRSAMDGLPVFVQHGKDRPVS